VKSGIAKSKTTAVFLYFTSTRGGRPPRLASGLWDALASGSAHREHRATVRCLRRSTHPSSAPACAHSKHDR